MRHALAFIFSRPGTTESFRLRLTLPHRLSSPASTQVRDSGPWDSMCRPSLPFKRCNLSSTLLLRETGTYLLGGRQNPWNRRETTSCEAICSMVVKHRVPSHQFTLPPVNMEPDKDPVPFQTHLVFQGRRTFGSLLIGGRVIPKLVSLVNGNQADLACGPNPGGSILTHTHVTFGKTA